MRTSQGYRWPEGSYQVTRSICWSPPGCHGGCGVLYYKQNGRLAKITGDEENPFNRGRMCVRGLAIREAVEHPQRLTKPLIRSGARGENRWREISFDEAIRIIADRLMEIKRNSSPESVIFCKGTARDIGAYLSRLCYGFGSPNYFGFGPGSGNACYRPRVALSTAVIGGLPIPDLGQFDVRFENSGEWTPPRCILIWGANPIYSNPDGLFGGWVTDLLKRGTELIVVDPQRTWLATQARHWLRIHPGTDGALALGMIHKLLEWGEVDRDFCAQWVLGLDGLEEAVAEYSSENTARMTGVHPQEITDAARTFARSHPANLIWGVSVDMHPDCLGIIHALIALITLTGNVEIPGGMVLNGDPFGVRRRGDDLTDFPETTVHRIGADRYPLLEVGNPYAQPDILLDQMESGNPYPIKGAWLQGTGLISSSFADPKRVLRLFKELDFIVMVDVFLTPAAAALADVVLPVAMAPEKDGIFAHFSTLGAINQAIAPPGDCRSDAEIILELGRRIAPDYFPWATIHEWLDERLKPSGFTFEELRDIGCLKTPLEYSKHTRGKLRRDGQPGFDTPSGKIELHSSLLERFGLAPIPYYHDWTEEFRKKHGERDFPYTLTTGARKPYSFASEHRNIPSLRSFQPDPLVRIHPETAAHHKIKEGDRVRVFSPFGHCFMRASIGSWFPPDVIHCDFGWWFPERNGAEPGLFGAFEANVNLLFPSGLQGPAGFGYPFRCFICNLEKMPEERDDTSL